jgi:hypothetical protein
MTLTRAISLFSLLVLPGALKQLRVTVSQEEYPEVLLAAELGAGEEEGEEA